MKFQYAVPIIATLHIFFVGCHSHCIGTCYSGRLFPENQDIFHGKHLKGYSYNNITTDDPVKCYRHCVQDCRCKACQMKDAKCELLDEDKISKPDDFKDGLRYVYFDLKQTLYQGKSDIVQPGVCYNGCCRSQPCRNGGTCVEHCISPKKKFSCTCPLNYHGIVCDKKHVITSCLDVLRYHTPKGSHPVNGKYYLHLQGLINRQVFCAFESQNRAWTLVESFSISKVAIYRKIAFHQGGTIFRNFENPNWHDYRHGRSFINYVRPKSTMFRVTCDFPRRSSLVPDYLFGYLRDYDIIDHGDVDGECFNFARINIRGKDFFNQSAQVWQKAGQCHFHIDCVGSKDCGLTGAGCIDGEDNFGYYHPVINTTKCTERENSTTQFWLGEEM